MITSFLHTERFVLLEAGTRYEVPGVLVVAVGTDVHGLGEHPATTDSYLQAYEPAATDVIHEDLCVGLLLVERPTIAHSDLLIPPSNVVVNTVNTSTQYKSI